MNRSLKNLLRVYSPSDHPRSEHIWKNVALNHFLASGFSAVNWCCKNESPKMWLFASYNVNWWTSQVHYFWIIAMFLSAFWSLVLNKLLYILNGRRVFSKMYTTALVTTFSEDQIKWKKLARKTKVSLLLLNPNRIKITMHVCETQIYITSSDKTTWSCLSWV